MRKAKKITPIWVDRLLLLSVISLLKYLMRSHTDGSIRYVLEGALRTLEELFAITTPWKRSSSKEHSGKEYSI